MPPILIHQSLHGYNDGHRLISSSLTFDPSDARVMLVMSDLSGSGVKPPANGYLTGYPLEKSGRYVLARTWAAPEMPRPGCVWTHSLIIENADLARVMSAKTLLDIFSRPTGAPTHSSLYGAPAHVTVQAKANGIERMQRVNYLLEALYSFPTKQIVVEAAESLNDEQVVTAIWMQQWPRLRRSFGFCTLSGMDRTKKGVALDLQFTRERGSQLLAKFPDALVAEQTATSETLRSLLDDLAEPASSTLREFLRRIGGDVDGGRRAMLPLCKLYTSLLESHPPDLVSAVAAFAALDGVGRQQARSVRSLLAQQAMKAPDQLEDVVFEFLLETLALSSDSAEQTEMKQKLGVEMWRRSPHRFHSALVSMGPLSDVALHALAKMESGQIVSGLQGNGDIAVDIAERRPDILVHTDFWRIPEVDDELVERISDQDAGLAVRPLLAAGRIGPAANIISRIEAGTLVVALESEGVRPNVLRGWLEALCRNSNKTAAVLASGHVTRMATVVAIARQTHPDDVPNAFGEDPWIVAILGASGSLNRSDQDFLAAFLLTRALGRESRSQADLFRYSYDRVYKGFEEGRFSYETEGLATRRLDWGTWFTWDNCSRLRETVTRRFVEHDLEPEIFGRLVDDFSLAMSLFDEAVRTGRGRKYLERVRNALKNSPENEMKGRADYIASKLK